MWWNKYSISSCKNIGYYLTDQFNEEQNWVTKWSHPPGECSIMSSFIFLDEFSVLFLHFDPRYSPARQVQEIWHRKTIMCTRFAKSFIHACMHASYRQKVKTMWFSKPDHLLVLEELHTWCAHNSSCFCYFLILLDINFNKMYILIKLINHLPLTIEHPKKRRGGVGSDAQKYVFPKMQTSTKDGWILSKLCKRTSSNSPNYTIQYKLAWTLPCWELASMSYMDHKLVMYIAHI